MSSSAEVISGPMRWSARVAAAFAGSAIAIILVLLIVRPDVNPARQMISEYALGPRGWLMTMCFIAFAAANGTLILALAEDARGTMGRIGLLFLVAAAAGPAMAAYFPTDPMTSSPGPMTFSGKMHGVSFMIGVPGEILAALLLSLVLRRRALWSGVPLMSLTLLTWASLVVMAAAIVIGIRAGHPGWAGWPNRLFMLSYAAWVIAAALPLVTSGRESAGRGSTSTGRFASE